MRRAAFYRRFPAWRKGGRTVRPSQFGRPDCGRLYFLPSSLLSHSAVGMYDLRSVGTLGLAGVPVDPALLASPAPPTTSLTMASEKPELGPEGGTSRSPIAEPLLLELYRCWADGGNLGMPEERRRAVAAIDGDAVYVDAQVQTV